MPTTTPADSLVCGVDDSPHATDVVAVAAGLSERLGLRLRLVHSAHANVFLDGARHRDAITRGQELLDGFGVNDKAEDRVVDIGDPAELLRAVIGEGAALAVVGSRGRGPGAAAFLGSVSNALARCSPCPVIVVPPGATVEIAAEPTVVCGVDGSRTAAAALEHAAALGSALGGRLVAVYVRSDALTAHATSLMPGKQPFGEPLAGARAELATVERPLSHLHTDIPISMRFETGYAAERLAAVAAEEPSAILVVGSRDRGPVLSAVLGSVSSRLAGSAPVPVMIVPAAARSATLSAPDADQERVDVPAWNGPPSARADA
jgi:nucleotide-binding universal stress UspA family protein